jgi:hypothetical protein
MHSCTMECSQRGDLSAVASDLAATSKALSDAVAFGTDETIVANYAALLIAKDKFTGALQVYRDHVAAMTM